MSFKRAEKLADAVLLEGYALYPYRASSTKNQYRWTFGVLAPRAFSEAQGSDRWWLRAECLLEGTSTTEVGGRLRFMHVQTREVERFDNPHFVACTALDTAAGPLVPWEEGELREIGFRTLLHTEHTLEFCIPMSRRVESVLGSSGALAGRVVRTCKALKGIIHVRSEPVVCSDGRELTRLSVRVENASAGVREDAARAHAMRSAFASAHVLLELKRGAFISLFEPPAGAQGAAASCHSEGTYPVLVGEPGTADLVLCSPIALYDYPEIAPESPGDFFDSGEIDELLALRTLTLTPEEKELARATDPRTRALLERVEAMTPESLARLHGAIRAPLAETRYRPGMRVRLRSSGRRTDAQDILYEGRTATIEELRKDVDGTEMVAVTLDDDPAAEMHRWYGRYHYYRLDELEPAHEGRCETKS